MNYIYKVVFGEWLYLKDVCQLDRAICQKFKRKVFLANLKGSYIKINYNKHKFNVFSNLIIKWVINKKLRFTNLLIDHWNKTSFTENELNYLYKPEKNSNLQSLAFVKDKTNIEIDTFSRFAETLIKLNKLLKIWNIG